MWEGWNNFSNYLGNFIGNSIPGWNSGAAQNYVRSYNLGNVASTDPIGDILTAGSTGSVGGLDYTPEFFTDFLKNPDGSWNWQGIGQGLTGLANLGKTVGGLYTAYKANDLAKKQFNFQKDLANINLNNNIREYNTKLGDIARTRSIMETGSDGAYADWYEQNKATRQV